jgi:hypothetical protein
LGGISDQLCWRRSGGFDPQSAIWNCLRAIIVSSWYGSMPKSDLDSTGLEDTERWGAIN